MYMILADIDVGAFVDTAVVDIEPFVAELFVAEEPTFVGIELFVVDTSPADTDHI